MTVFSEDMSKSMDFVTSKMGTNPHLPDHRRQEVELKRRALADQIDVTLSLYRNKNEPLNEVLYQVNAEGLQQEKELIHRRFSNEASIQQASKQKSLFFDCSDDIWCQ